MSENLTISWADTIFVVTEDMPQTKFIQYLEYNESPCKDIDEIIRYANWCADSGFKTRIYPDNKEPDFYVKILLRILFWLGLKIGKLSSRLIVGCPNHV